MKVPERLLVSFDVVLHVALVRPLPIPVQHMHRASPARGYKRQLFPALISLTTGCPVVQGPDFVVRGRRFFWPR